MPEIDFVIAWVDGADPAHAEARRRYGPELEGAYRGTAAEIRFHDSGEIYYLIASILKYAPFVRRVYIVTDNQKPKLLDSFAEAGLCDPSFLEIVSHDVIFDGLNAVRPVFSPRPIEAAMWRIPGLSEHFVYFNDDMFVNAPLSPEDVFRSDGRPVLHGTMARTELSRLKFQIRMMWRAITGDKSAVRPKHSIAQEKAALLAGMTGRYFYAAHHPHPLRRSTLENFYSKNPDVLAKQLQFRFRNIEQHNPVALASNLEIRLHDTPVERKVPVSYIRADMRRSSERVLDEIRNDASLYGCIQNFEKLSGPLLTEVQEILAAKFRGTLPMSKW